MMVGMEAEQSPGREREGCGLDGSGLDAAEVERRLARLRERAERLQPWTMYGPDDRRDDPGWLDAAGRAAELVDDALAGLFELLDGVVGVGDHREVAAVMRQAERLVRGAEALSIRLTGDVDARRLFVDDGHRDARDWLKATVNVPGGVASARVRCARLFTRVRDAGELLAEGSLGVAQVRELGRVYTNPRLGEVLDAAAPVLVESAVVEDYVTFCERVREFVRLHDEDGAHRGEPTGHAARRLHLSRVGDCYVLSGRFGVIQGDALEQIFQAFVDAEYATDRDDAIRRVGEALASSHLPRTATQRRADALLAIFLAAATAPPGGGKEIDVNVDIVIDHHTWEQWLANVVAEVADPLHTIRNQRPGWRPWHPEPTGYGLPAEPAGLWAKCHTINGAPVDPVEAVVFGLIGHARRVVVDARGVVIDLGRRVRCYSGAARDAVRLQAAIAGVPRCIWPGCGRRRTQIDHAQPWDDHGHTDPANGDLLCQHHNLVKNHGYTTRRDDNGRWHVYRPDGTEILAA